MCSSGKSESTCTGQDISLADGAHQEAKDKMNVLRTKNVKKYHLGPKVLVFQKKLLQKCFYRVANFKWSPQPQILTESKYFKNHYVAKSLKFILGFEISEKSHF